MHFRAKKYLLELNECPLTIELRSKATNLTQPHPHNHTFPHNHSLSLIDEGSFVNDVAFARHDGAEAYGTVVTEGETEVMMWDWQQLREYLNSRPEMDRNMRFCFTQHLVKGLMQQREAAHLKHLKTGEEDWATTVDDEGGAVVVADRTTK